MILGVFNVAATLVICLAAGYFILTMGAGIATLRRHDTRLHVQGQASYGKPHEDAPSELYVYFLVPCLNEAEVIGGTVAGLIGNPNATVVVVDDGSDDATSDVALSHGIGEVQVVRRNLPDARKGKGEALNAGLARIRELVSYREQDENRVIVCVMDADGRLSDKALSYVLPLFDEDDVGGVQLAVRIRNRHNFLTRFQDFQFWSMSAVTQFGRERTGTVSLGGNGQFTRLVALNQVGEKPWSNSLTEDLDLAVTLALRGWRLSTTPFASVDQQGVDKLGLLIKQRTRWYQGHMLTARRLPEIWRSRKLSHGSALEMSAYIMVPWLLDLPWSILYQFCILGLAANHQVMFGFADGPIGLVSIIVGWYALAFAPALATGFVYLRRDRTVGFFRAMALGHSFLVMNYVSFICAWRSLARILRGETSWDKTARSREQLPGAEAAGTA
ncbi:glycosyltransferase [Phytoactinopolyspora limicola]|uniref:glycosyltransferase n=1 Tax=Phytoactinopolyspora limicola TaxID=2715536 RepID=UPI00140C18AA|nr:glycosyltransferase family 2 protein [Phytoactinopolyspora limicola]